MLALASVEAVIMCSHIGVPKESRERERKRGEGNEWGENSEEEEGEEGEEEEEEEAPRKGTKGETDGTLSWTKAPIACTPTALAL